MEMHGKHMMEDKVKKIITILLLIGMIPVFVSSQTADRPRIGVISKGYQHDFWRTVESGVQAAADEFNVDAYFIGPEKETEIGKQVSMVEDAINGRVDAIALAALDTRALIPVSRKAVNAGIPLVTFDSGIQGTLSKSFIATDNEEGGRIAAEQLARLINNRGKVVIIAHNQGTSTAIDRVAGAEKEFAKYPNIELVNILYSDGDISKALSITQDILTANPDLKGIFATNEGSALGVARAIEEKDASGKIAFVGYDSSEDQVRYIQNGTMNGTVVQDPFNMGYLSIKTLVDILENRTVSNRIDTGATYVSLANLDEEKIQKLLYPLGKE